MTREQLGEHVKLGQQLAKSKELLKKLKGSYKTTPTLTGMPRGGGVSDKVGELAQQIVDLENRIEEKNNLFMQQEKQVVDFIIQAEDDYLYTALSLRYLSCWRFEKIAEMIGNSEDATKMMIYRWVDAHQD